MATTKSKKPAAAVGRLISLDRCHSTATCGQAFGDRASQPFFLRCDSTPIRPMARRFGSNYSVISPPLSSRSKFEPTGPLGYSAEGSE